MYLYKGVFLLSILLHCNTCNIYIFPCLCYCLSIQRHSFHSLHSFERLTQLIATVYKKNGLQNGHSLDKNFILSTASTPEAFPNLRLRRSKISAYPISNSY